MGVGIVVEHRQCDAHEGAEESSASSGSPPVEESLLWDALRRGDEDARETLIVAYRPLVFWFLGKLKAPAGCRQDLAQEGMLALIGAVDAFDADRGTRFSTFAYHRIRGRMLNYLERVEARAPTPVAGDYLSSCRSAEQVPDEWVLSLRESLAALSEGEEAIIRKLFFEGAQAKEYARECGIDVSYLHRLKRRVLVKLRHLLGAGSATPGG
ncbi:MAG: sigma-70 family RNA polymerase sigma factor [Synergistales bacterium]|nr:sigma-70 family RNA polymerase sigma factor [Synergistales bacterium]